MAKKQKLKLARCWCCKAQAMTPTGEMWLDHLRPDGRRCLKSLELKGVYIHGSRASAGYAPWR
jgi:hypothetical protein